MNEQDRVRQNYAQ